MRKNLFLMIGIVGMFTILAACSQQTEKVVESPQFLDVQLTINPTQGNINEMITFQAKVLYGDKEVTDPDEVTFEIWHEHDEQHEKVEPVHKGKGLFALEKRFSIEGTYYIYAHVTAEGMHYMPKKEFIIGQLSEPEEDRVLPK